MATAKPTTTATTTPAGVSYLRLPTPRSASELNAYCEAGRNEHRRRADRLAEVAAELNKFLRASVPNGPLGSWAVARQVTRHLKINADQELDVSRAFWVCWTTFQEKVLNAQTGSTPFDINK